MTGLWLVAICCRPWGALILVGDNEVPLRREVLSGYDKAEVGILLCSRDPASSTGVER